MQRDKAKGELRLTKDEWRVLGFTPVGSDDERVRPESDAMALWQATHGLIEPTRRRILGALGMEDEVAFMGAQDDLDTLTHLGEGLGDIVDPSNNPDVAALAELFYQSPDQ